MIRNVIHPLSTTLFGPGVYEVILEMAPIVQIHSFWVAMSPLELLFKIQDSVPGSGTGHVTGFHPSSGCFHHYEHTALALAGLWESVIINLPGLSIFVFQPSSSIPLRFYLSGLLDCSTFHIHG